MTGIECLADSIKAELEQLLPEQRKTQRGKLSLLVATMLDARSANLMDLATALPLEADRTDMRYQWIARFLANPRSIPTKSWRRSPARFWNALSAAANRWP